MSPSRSVINACEFFVAFTRTNSDNRRVMRPVGHKSSGVRECYCQKSRHSPPVWVPTPFDDVQDIRERDCSGGLADWRSKARRSTRMKLMAAVRQLASQEVSNMKDVINPIARLKQCRVLGRSHHQSRYPIGKYIKMICEGAAYFLRFFVTNSSEISWDGLGTSWCCNMRQG